MNRALFVAPNEKLTFVARDLEVLSEAFEVETVWRADHRSEKGTVAEFFSKLASLNYDLSVIWFAEPYDAPWLTGLARLLRVPPVLVVGGYETTYIPELDYGSLRYARNRRKLKMALAWARLVLPTSELLASEVRQLGRSHGVEVIYPGIDCALFNPGHGARDDLVVTVATICERTIQLKGLDTFARVSKEFPDVTFAILGPSEDESVRERLQSQGGTNLCIEGRHLSSRELVSWFQRAKVYAQLSARESFGVALAEAMACGCRPVVSDRGALPEVVGNVGSIVPYGDLHATADAVGDAISSGSSAAARRRVRECFDQGIRSRKLLASLKALCD